ncbi:ATP-binding cassette domain-containing protein [Aerococcaceae bacterium DSM 109653]|uniref:ATP-binding cassette domain-containing protein n=1 Tax=Fundicoccus ignavus TaxID=2664442 RepID=A0A844BUW3_9LACT|nr:ABC transporter ATP-binding protein [Fundicoccus ignavus]MRI81399.1 ATP-binding cassette domain-containing protein [Fundicoccus ignavus]
MILALWQYIKKNPVHYVIAGVLAIISSLLYLIPNYIIQLFVDGIVENNLIKEDMMRYFMIFGITMIFIYLTEATWVILTFGQSMKYQTELRTKMFRHLLTFRAPFFERFRSGDLMTRMTTDIDMMGTAIGYGFMLVVADGSLLIGVFLIMVTTISWQATLLSIIPLVIFGFIIYHLGMELDKRYENSRDEVAKLSNEVLEVVDGVRVMRAYGKKQLEQKRFQEKTHKVMGKANELVWINGAFRQVARLFSGLSIAIGLLYGGYLVGKTQMTIGELVTFQIYLGFLNGTIWGMAELVGIYQQGKVSYRKINELETADDLVDKQGILPIDQIEVIQFDQYQFTYPEDKQAVLKDINFTLKRGETLGIVGKTGSGKSTLIKQLLRQYPNGQKGQLLMNNVAISQYDMNALEKLIGYVPQEHILFSKSVKHNIEFGNADATEETFAQSIRTADFEKDVLRMSEGLDTLIGEKGVAISGGQKQRVSMARAMIREPELLILDDSLSAVDAKTEQAIIGNIQQIRHNKTTIIVTHRLSAVAHADNILVIEDGTVVEAGTPDQLINNKGWYYQQYQKQQTMEVNHENI